MMGGVRVARTGVCRPYRERSVRGYYPPVPWRAVCDGCEQEAPISRPVLPTLGAFLKEAPDDIEAAEAYYGPHPRAVDSRPCTGGPARPSRAPRCGGPTRQRLAKTRRPWPWPASSASRLLGKFIRFTNQHSRWRRSYFGEHERW
jgi:hypothetical protein